jgi:protein tyrosine phosphatase
MKVGDLVNFYTRSEVWQSFYTDSSPGIIISVTDLDQRKNIIADVYWRNGTVTREHSSFLQPVEDEDEAR